MPNKRKEDLYMKKTTKKLICAILSLVMLFSGMLSLTTSALTTNCVEEHFDNLKFTYDFGSNTAHPKVPINLNSCCYVSMSMMLAFYDTYWNDRFVDDSLEWSSGSYDLSKDNLKNTFHAGLEVEAYESWLLENPQGTDDSFVAEHKNIFLHSYLVSLGIEWGYYINDENSFGLNVEETVSFLERYLYSICHFSSHEVVVKTMVGSEEELIEKMEEQISNGFPLIYCGWPENSNTSESESNTLDGNRIGHAMIAFAKNPWSSYDDIRLHDGSQDSTPFDTVKTTIYDQNQAIIWLEIKNLPHTHSDKYVDEYTGLSMCACEIYSTHPKHENNHVYVYHSDTERAYKTCHCGDEIELCVHEWSYSMINETFHSEICLKCLERRNMDHVYDIPTLLSDTEHGLKCVCGHQGTETEAHYAHSYSSIRATTHRIFCACGKQIGIEAHNMMGIGSSSAVCVDCGYVGKQPSGNIIMGKEDDTDTLTE